MAFAVSVLLLVTGAVLVITVDSPNHGPNLQTAGLVLMVIALTALTVLMNLREPPGSSSDRDDVHGIAGLHR